MRARSHGSHTYPGFEVDLFVEAEPRALIEWHLGRIKWIDALRADRIRVHGPSKLARALPTWNHLSPAAHTRDAQAAASRRGVSALIRDSHPGLTATC